ncbi:MULTISPECIES: hypothetical protein [unclassified Streptomyces]|uniref:hypothetical protein n=1 Tax=unclassified Streptomyces TaxID=2593676 RepID=UPI0016605751|nr:MULTISPECIES: hypothetical protein [unclassified Streptomyces]
MSTRPTTRACTYCLRTGADICVRKQVAPEGALIYAHKDCASARKAKPLFEFTDSRGDERP